MDFKFRQAVEALKSRIWNEFGSGVDVVVFGSAARGDFDAASDIDVLVLAGFSVDSGIEERIFDLAYDVEMEFGVIFGILVYAADFFYSAKFRVTPLFRNIERDGVPV